MTQDVRESLTALAAVSGLAACFALVLALEHRFGTPAWITPRLQGAMLVVLGLVLARAAWRRSKRADPGPAKRDEGR
jgi:predicted signal transduction protein with EAL and GGDEF domain